MKPASELPRESLGACLWMRSMTGEPAPAYLPGPELPPAGQAALEVSGTREKMAARNQEGRR